MIFKIQINSQMLVIVESQFIFLPKYKYGSVLNRVGNP